MWTLPLRVANWTGPKESAVLRPGARFIHKSTSKRFGPTPLSPCAPFSVLLSPTQKLPLLQSCSHLRLRRLLIMCGRFAGLALWLCCSAASTARCSSTSIRRGAACKWQQLDAVHPLHSSWVGDADACPERCAITQPQPELLNHRLQVCRADVTIQA